MEIKRKIAVTILFAVCLLFFLERGPYRGIRFWRTNDFATVYAAARCWMNGENPYENSGLEKQLRESGAPQNIIDHQSVNPCLYFVSALPIVSLVAWLPWKAANVTWCVLLLGAFAASLFVLVKRTNMPAATRWIFTSAALLFCPTYVGVMYGNPAVLTASVVALAICINCKRRFWAGGLLLGVGLALKPQIALCGVLVWAVWKCWTALFVSFGVLGTAFTVGVLRANSLGRILEWWHTQQRNIAFTLAPGGRGDPSLNDPWSSELLNGQTIPALFTTNFHLCDVLVWTFAAAAVLAYLYRRKEYSQPQPWRDAGFFASVTTFAGYHRYCDGQVFLLLIPFLAVLWEEQSRKLAALLGLCLLLIAFPSQTVLPRLLGPGSTTHLWEQLLLLRHQPLAILAMMLILLFSFGARFRAAAA